MFTEVGGSHTIVIKDLINRKVESNEGICPFSYHCTRICLYAAKKTMVGIKIYRKMLPNRTKLGGARVYLGEQYNVQLNIMNAQRLGLT